MSELSETLPRPQTRFVGSKMTPNDQKCLLALCDSTLPDGEMCVGFALIERQTSLPRNVVRISVRRLARKGMAQFFTGLFNEDGEVAGSGYCITNDGIAFVEALPESKIPARKRDSTPNNCTTSDNISYRA